MNDQKAQRPHKAGGKAKRPYQRRGRNSANVRLTPEQEAAHEARILAEQDRIARDLIERLQ